MNATIKSFGIDGLSIDDQLQRFLYLLVTYLIYIHVGKGLPTYCVKRAVGRQPFAANDNQSNQ